MTERWLPVPGYEGHYEVSDLGQVRSIDRMIFNCGVNKYVQSRGRILKQTAHPNRRKQVSLCRGAKRYEAKVHHLVLAAFIGPRPPGMETLHWDDDPSNNRLSNLRYGTQSENMFDRVRNGREHNSRKTECVNGHEFTSENTYVAPGTTWRQCRACRRKDSRRRATRRAQARHDLRVSEADQWIAQVAG